MNIFRSTSFSIPTTGTTPFRGYNRMLKRSAGRFKAGIDRYIKMSLSGKYAPGALLASLLVKEV